MRGAFVDLRDRVFGRLVVVDVHDKAPTGSVRWSCLCECGASHVAISGHLTAGHVRSCGCLSRERRPAHLWSAESVAKSVAARLAKRAERFEQDRRRVFGLLAPLESIDRSGEEFWRCECACGTTKLARAADIRRGKTRSCGCVRVPLDFTAASYGMARKGAVACA